MRRREFIGLVGGAAAAWPLVAQAQQPGRIRRIGILSGFPEDHPEGQAQRAALFQGLRELGWIEGKNFQIELFRWVTNNSERMHANVQELVKLNPDLLLSLSTNPPDLLALMKETTTIPIVFTNTTDPIGGGITSSLANPNINVTGFPNFEFSVAGKWMELLKQIAPTVARAALLFNPDTGHQGFLYEPYFNAAAAKLGVEPYLMTWRDAAEMERAFAAHGKGNGLVVVNNTSNGVNSKAIFALASQYELPAVFPYRWWAIAGGLLAYGPDMIEAHRLAASYIDRILKGENPGSLPIQQPTKYDLVINLKDRKIARRYGARRAAGASHRGGRIIHRLPSMARNGPTRPVS